MRHNPYKIVEMFEETMTDYCGSKYAISTDNFSAAEWFKKGRYEGRCSVMYHNDSIEINGWNAYMSPEQAARGLMLMQNYPEHVRFVFP
jgi:hypothetical protein